MWKFMMVAMLYSSQFPPQQELYCTTWVRSQKACESLKRKNATVRDFEVLGVKYKLEVKVDCQWDEGMDTQTAVRTEAELQEMNHTCPQKPLSELGKVRRRPAASFPPHQQLPQLPLDEGRRPRRDEPEEYRWGRGRGQ